MVRSRVLTLRAVAMGDVVLMGDQEIEILSSDIPPLFQRILSDNPLAGRCSNERLAWSSLCNEA